MPSVKSCLDVHTGLAISYFEWFQNRDKSRKREHDRVDYSLNSKAHVRSVYASNPSRRKTTARAAYKADPDKKNAADRAYYRANCDVHKAKVRA